METQTTTFFTGTSFTWCYKSIVGQSTRIRSNVSVSGYVTAWTGHKNSQIT